VAEVGGAVVKLLLLLLLLLRLVELVELGAGVGAPVKQSLKPPRWIELSECQANTLDPAGKSSVGGNAVVSWCMIPQYLSPKTSRKSAEHVDDDSSSHSARVILVASPEYSNVQSSLAPYWKA
jgi:hypothetical protein